MRLLLNYFCILFLGEPVPPTETAEKSNLHGTMILRCGCDSLLIMQDDLFLPCTEKAPNFFFQERKGRKEGEFDSVGFCGNSIWICGKLPFSSGLPQAFNVEGKRRVESF